MFQEGKQVRPYHHPMIVQLSVNTSDVIADEFLHKIHERVMREDGLVIAAGDETAKKEPS